MGWERPPPYDEPKKDFVTDALRLAYAGPPHFAARGDLGDEEENLVWAATVRANEDGRVVAVAPGHTLPVNSGCDADWWNDWLQPFRLVVTVVRDTDAKMCQIVDIRGWKSRQQEGGSCGFHKNCGDCETGGAEFRVVDCDGDGDLDAFLYFGHEPAPLSLVPEPGRLERIWLEWMYVDDVAPDVATVASKLATLHWI